MYRIFFKSIHLGDENSLKHEVPERPVVFTVETVGWNWWGNFEHITYVSSDTLTKRKLSTSTSPCVLASLLTT